MIACEDKVAITHRDGHRSEMTMEALLDADTGVLPGRVEDKLQGVTLRITMPGREPEEVTFEEMAARKSTRMWMHMIQTGWDRRRLKRIMRLVKEGR